ncbi:putative late blight resistance protein homolog R1B-23 [Coffea arabica]|uniref:Late blight resistance protein homolog R1B-23 n=1 Tax=Coffea arabica TaxID=13443 RepID=A0ABM4X9R6_COFAR
MAWRSFELQFHLGLALTELHRQLQQEGWRFGCEGVAGVSGLRGLLNPNLRRIGDQKLYNTLDDRITKLQDDANFLITFRDCIHKWTDPGYVIRNSGFLVSKINAEIVDIAGKLRIACRKKYVSKCPSKLIDVLSNLLTNIQKLKPEIAQACQALSASRSFQVVSPLHRYFLWVEFVHSVAATNIRPLLKKVDRFDQQENLAALVESLNKLISFLNSAQKGFEDGFLRDRSIIDGFLVHAASVVTRAANLSCFFWSKHWADPTSDRDMADSTITDLSNLRSEIDFTTPKMTEFALKFLNALSKISHGRTANHEADIAATFLEQVLCGESKTCFSKELLPLVIFVLNEPGESLQPLDAKCFSAEIKHLILEAALLRQRWVTGKIRLIKEKMLLLEVQIFLKEQLGNSTIFRHPAEDQIKVLHKKLKNLLNDRSGLQEAEFENGKRVFDCIEKATAEIESLYQSLKAEKIKKSKLRSLVSLLLSKILLFKACWVLMELRNGEETLTGLKSEDQIEAFLIGAKLVLALLEDKKEKSKEHEEKMYMKPMEAIIWRITHLYYSIIAQKVEKEVIENLFSGFIHEMEIITAELRGICPKISRSNFPNFIGTQFFDFLSANLLELIKRNPDSIALVKDHIEKIQLDLVSFTSLFTGTSYPDNEHQELKDLSTCLTEMAYEVEYVIDSIEMGIGANLQHLVWIYDLQERIRFIKNLAKNTGVPSVAQIRGHVRQASTPKTDKMVISLGDQEQEVIDRLTWGSSKRDVVSLVGMAGIGKTTLAKKLYNDPNIVYHFHCRAWCSVSQVYLKRDLLLNILRDIEGLTDEIHEMSDADLEQRLRQRLLKNKYLIVLDDVWDVEVWNVLERSLPDDGNGSRIMITSRLRKVALEAEPDRDPHSLRLLNDDESWKLLQMKIFQEEGCCPEELVDIGEQIAERCGGLPLAVVAVAGILEKTEKELERWELIAKELNSLVIGDAETRCKDILQLSYSHLPAHLKACFLYFGAFQGEKDVRVSKLIQLWIAEGFVQKKEPRSLEETAEEYLLDLIDRSLVIISKKRSKGGVKACRIHDLLRDLCQSQSSEDKFLQLVTRYDEPYASLLDSDHWVDFDSYYPSNPVKYESHRLCICLKRKVFVDSRPSGPRTRSLIFSASSDTYPRRPYNLSFIPRHFKLVKVLDLECINIGHSFPTEMEFLVQLRYLAISGDMGSIPRSISNLWKLETLIVKGLSGMVLLPDSLWCMTWLRHIHVKKQAAFSMEDDTSGNSFQLENLVTFSSLSLSFGMDTEKILRKLPNLRSFSCIFLDARDSSQSCNQFPRLDFLPQLESLKIFYAGRTRKPGEFSLPLNLKKLTLSSFGLPWDHISTIGRLPNLQVLKLVSDAFDGESWDMREDEFPELRFLQLDSLNLVQWNASCDHLPKLAQLVLRNCKRLQEVPYDFADIPTLELIQVQRCGKSLEESVRSIGEATECIQVLISRSYS